MAKAKNAEAKQQEYVLKRGYTHNGFDEDGDRHLFVGGQEGNDRVMLSATQAAQFKDRFESVEEMQERQKMQDELQKSQKDMDKLKTALESKGMSIDDLLAEAETTTKKPNPTPSVGAAEPTPKDTTPPPVGSTANPTAGTQAAGTAKK